VLREYGIDGRFVTGRHVTVFLLRSCVRVGGVKPQSFTVGVGLRQGCVLSQLIFIVYMNWLHLLNKAFNIRLFAFLLRVTMPV